MTNCVWHFIAQMVWCVFTGEEKYYFIQRYVHIYVYTWIYILGEEGRRQTP